MNIYFKYVTENEIYIIRKDDDGIIWWLGLGEQDPKYLEWLAEGNEPSIWQSEGVE